MTARSKLVGRRFGKLKVFDFAGTDSRGRSLWFCLCDCGGGTIARVDDLKAGYTRSCGHLHGNNYHHKIFHTTVQDLRGYDYQNRQG